jgi:hypothetical protein
VSEPSQQEIDHPTSGELARTFVDLARSVAGGADVVEVFTVLSERCVQLLPVAAGGLQVMDAYGVLQVIGPSNHSAHLLDLFQLQNEEGPCLVCCRTGDAVEDVELNDDGPWPTFASMARDHGYRAVYALPLKARTVVLGALNLFAESPLDANQLDVARALADAATLALLQADPVEDAVIVIRQLHLAVEARNTVEQAKGMLSQRFQVEPDEALNQLRRAATLTGERLLAVATAVVDRDPASEAARLLSSAPLN